MKFVKDGELNTPVIIATLFLAVFGIAAVSSALVIVPAGYVGVDYNAWGGINLEKIRTPGWSFKVPVLQTVYMIKTARDTISMYGIDYPECKKDPECSDIAVQVPSKEGLLITVDISVFYKVKPAIAPRIVQEMTVKYKEGTVMPRVRSATREVTGSMTITELYGTGREKLQHGVYEQLFTLFEKDGLILEEVLVRDVEYPAQIRQAIEEKQTMEQSALKKHYEVELAQKEAQRKKIEGEGIANQKIAIAQGDAEALRLVSNAIKENPQVLQFKWLEITQKLYENPNTKFIALPSGQMILPIDLNLTIGR